MTNNKEKKVRIHSSFNEHIKDNDSEEIEIEVSNSKVSKGRPCKPQDELRLLRIKLNCNDSEKSLLYEHFEDSGDMRDFLLKSIREGRV